MKLYAEISKTEKQNDGTIKVFGYASTESVDSDGETITAEAMKAALPEYMKFGAVREMHQPSAAGTAIVAKVEDDGRTYFGAHIVDPVAVKKIEAGVYKGFSIGGKALERDNLNKTIIKSLKLVEVSLVDRPANPDAVFTCYKAEGIEKSADEQAIDEIAKMLDEKIITPVKLVDLMKSEVKKASGTDEDDDATLDAFNASAMLEDEEAESPEAIIAGFMHSADPEEKAMLAEALSNAGVSEKGDFPGHPFRGNQHVSGESGGASRASSKAKGKESSSNHRRAAAANRAAARRAESAGRGKSAAYHRTMASFHESRSGKATKAEMSDVTKISAEITDIKNELQKVLTERETMKARLEQLERMPEPGKGLLKVIQKTDDTLDTTKTAEIDLSKLSPEQRAMEEIKKSYKTGGMRLIG